MVIQYKFRFYNNQNRISWKENRKKFNFFIWWTLLVIDIFKEPISFNHYTFKFNDNKQIIKGNKEFYLLGNSTYIYKFNKVNTYSTIEKIDFDYMIPFNNQFIIFDNDNFMRLCELKKRKEMIKKR